MPAPQRLPIAVPVGPDGRLTLPPEARRALDLRPGTSVIVEVDGNVVHLGRREHAVPPGERELGRMRGTIRFEDDIVSSTDPNGWEPREL